MRDLLVQFDQRRAARRLLFVELVHFSLDFFKKRRSEGQLASFLRTSVVEGGFRELFSLLLSFRNLKIKQKYKCMSCMENINVCFVWNIHVEQQVRKPVVRLSTDPRTIFGAVQRVFAL